MEEVLIEIKLLCKARVYKHDSYKWGGCCGHGGIGGLGILGSTRKNALKAERKSMIWYLRGLLEQGDPFPDWVNIEIE